MAITSRVTALLCAVFSLVVLTELAAARSVPAESVLESTETEVADAEKFLVEAEMETDFPDSRANKRSVPTWNCQGAFSTGEDSYDVDCITFLQVEAVECTLDGSPYYCGGIDFSINTRDFASGEQHVLQMEVKVRYGNRRGTIWQTFRFRKQVTSIVFSPSISLTSTSGVTRTLQFTLRKAQAVFSARCGYMWLQLRQLWEYSGQVLYQRRQRSHPVHHIHYQRRGREDSLLGV
jgi:hypothetical protein